MVHQAFPPVLDDQDFMDDLFVSVEPPTLTLDLGDVLVVQVITKFGPWDDHMWSLNYLHACLC